MKWRLPVLFWTIGILALLAGGVWWVRFSSEPSGTFSIRGFYPGEDGSVEFRDGKVIVNLQGSTTSSQTYHKSPDGQWAMLTPDRCGGSPGAVSTLRPGLFSLEIVYPSNGRKVVLKRKFVEWLGL